MPLKIPTAALTAVAASALTAGALLTFNATAATKTTPPTLKGIAVQETALAQVLQQQEERSRRIDDRVKTIYQEVDAIFRRQGRYSVNYGTPYYLLQEIYCSVHDISPCSPTPSG